MIILILKTRQLIFIGDEFTNKEYQDSIDEINPLNELIKKYCKEIKADDVSFLKEVLLWGLSSFKKLSKNRMLDGIEFKDSLGSYLKNLNSDQL